MANHITMNKQKLDDLIRNFGGDPLDPAHILSVIESSFLTTGQVAKFFDTAARTITRWCDTGKMENYRLPHGKDRRIPKESIVKFIKENKIPFYVSQLARLAGVPCYVTPVVLNFRKASPVDVVSHDLYEL